MLYLCIFMNCVLIDWLSFCTFLSENMDVQHKDN